MKDKISSKDSFYYCLSKLIVFESEILNPELY